jgi:hypothetical protein
MVKEVCRYRFGRKVQIRHVEESIFLAMIAAEGLHGRPRVRMEASYLLDAKKRACVVDTTTDVGRDIARILTSFLAREFGQEAGPSAADRVSPMGDSNDGIDSEQERSFRLRTRMVIL